MDEKLVNLSPLRAGTKRQGSNGAKMLRKYGTEAIRAARRDSGIVAGMHGDPAFYVRPLAHKAGAPYVVKKGA